MLDVSRARLGAGFRLRAESRGPPPHGETPAILGVAGRILHRDWDRRLSIWAERPIDVAVDG